MRARRYVTDVVLAVLAVGAILLVMAGCAESEPTPGPTPTPEVLIDGVPADVYEQAVAEWDAVVNQWNELTVARDEAGEDVVTVDGLEFETFEDWATARGHPLTFEQVLITYERQGSERTNR